MFATVRSASLRSVSRTSVAVGASGSGILARALGGAAPRFHLSAVCQGVDAGAGSGPFVRGFAWLGVDGGGFGVGGGGVGGTRGLRSSSGALSASSLKEKLAAAHAAASRAARDNANLTPGEKAARGEGVGAWAAGGATPAVAKATAPKQEVAAVAAVGGMLASGGSGKGRLTGKKAQKRRRLERRAQEKLQGLPLGSLAPKNAVGKKKQKQQQSGKGQVKRSQHSEETIMFSKRVRCVREDRCPRTPKFAPSLRGTGRQRRSVYQAIRRFEGLWE